MNTCNYPSSILVSAAFIFLILEYVPDSIAETRHVNNNHAAANGAQDNRQRTVPFITLRNKTGSDIAFPAATHGSESLWASYSLPFAHLSRIGHGADADTLNHVTFDDACSDLPPLAEGQTIDGVAYRRQPRTPYQRLMRQNSKKVR